MVDPNEHVIEYLDEYLHEFLTAADAANVDQHMERCLVCQTALEEARKRFDAIQTVPHSEASEELISKTIQNATAKVERVERNWRRLRNTVTYVTVASIFVIAAFNVHFYRMAPTPFDVRVLGQSELLAGSAAAMRVGVFDNRNGEGVENVPIELTLADRKSGEPVALTSFSTSQDGTASGQFNLPDWEPGRYELLVSARPDGKTETLPEFVKLKRSWKLMLSTDKPIYQPGQTINLRSLALRRPDLKPLVGNEVVFTITDPKGNVIFKQRDVTSKFGITSADCPLATEIIEGVYEIACQLGDSTSKQTVEVSRYVLPKFKVTIGVDKSFYQTGEMVRGQIQADYFFGKPVVGGDVDIFVRSADVSNRQLFRDATKTDGDGNATFEFKLPDSMVGLEQYDGDAQFELFATLNDSAGQTYSTKSSRIVTNQPIKLTIIPEAGSFVKGIANRVYVYASYADGRPATVRLVVSGIQQELETNMLGVADFDVTPENDNVSLTVKATDDDGLIGRTSQQFQCGTGRSNFVIRSNKAVFDGGDTMTLTVHGGGVEPVFIDLVKNEQTILSDMLDVTGGNGQKEIDLPAELFGSLQLVAYRFGADGLAVRKSRSIFVRQASELSVGANLDHKEYRPGEKATIQFTVTDGQGNPAPSALGVSIVDEAVFSVMNQSAGMERVFFLLENELLQPVYDIYDDWTPFAELPLAENEREDFEQALFARTAQSQSVGSQETMRFNDRNSTFTLVSNSFPAKQRLVRQQRGDRLQRTVVAWISLAVSMCCIGLVTFAVYRPKAFIITTGIVFSLSVFGMCLLGAFAFLLIGAKSAGVPVANNFAMPTSVMAEWDVAAASDGMEMPTESAPTTEDAPDPSESPGAGATQPPRVRKWFPETLLWRPELITDDRGIATLEIDPLADSITTWRVSTSAVSAGGHLGAAEHSIRVFQPFFVDINLPVAFTRNDEVKVPLVAYNYLDEPQSVALIVEKADWFDWLEADSDLSELSIDLGPGEVKSVSIPMRLTQVGKHQLRVTATAGEVSDAIERNVVVEPNGRRVEHVASGMLDRPFELDVEIPEDIVPGSTSATLRLHPSSFSQLVEGLDAIFQMPHGCFEQTSSTTYPNILALDYLRETKKNLPAVEAKARQYIHIGYQRLVSFEVSGGGFDWYGNPPGNRTLTAYGLMEFEDMASVHDVDPKLIERTRDWLLSKRVSDGSWVSDHSVSSVGAARSNLTATAYIAWAVFGTGKADNQSKATIDFLLRHPPESIQDPYTISLIAQVLASVEPPTPQLADYFNRLDDLKHTDAEENLVWWTMSSEQSTPFYGQGRPADIETTAMAALAMMKAGKFPATVQGALNWLVRQKDSRGTWHSTQATVLALKALIRGTGSSQGDDQNRRVEIAVDGQSIETAKIPADQSDVMKQVDLSSFLRSGNQTLKISEPTNAGTGYQIVLRYYTEDELPEASDDEPLSIDIQYESQRLTVDDRITATATVVNNMDHIAPMVILDLPIPPGFELERQELDELQGSKLIAKYQITPRKAIIYLRELDQRKKLELRYRLRATMPVRVNVPPAQVYEYYDPDKRGKSQAVILEAIEV